MKFALAIHTRDGTTTAYLLKAWKRSETGWLWQSVMVREDRGPVQEWVKSLAKFMDVPLFEADNTAKGESTRLIPIKLK